MAHAYTPGLTVTADTTVRKRRVLPLRGEVLVSEGQEVEADTVVARADLPGDVHPVNVVGRLGIRPQEVREYMLVEEGDEVEKDQPVAETDPWISWFKAVCRSPIDGTVENISEVTGQVLLREPPRKIELMAHLKGRVVEVLPEEGAVVESRGALLQGIFGLSGERVGTLTVPVNTAEEQMEAADVTEEYSGRAVVCGASLTAELVEAAREAGVVALIAGSVSSAELEKILGRDIGVAVTGSEKIGLTLIVTEGFGRLPIARNTFKLLKGLEGHEASVSGATQIRAGVLRPEVFVPLADDQIEERAADQSVHSDGVRENDRVRIIREPDFGRIGRVLELVPELEQVESGARVRVLRLETEDGQTLTVPRANVEVISGEGT